MSMITELVERLREHADNPELDMDCTLSCDGECNKILREAADVIEELSAKIQAANMERSSQYYNGGWILVSERLPILRGSCKISDDVLITNGFEIDMGYLVERNGKIFWHYYGSEIEVGIKDEDNDATAWMPLPEPYKENET